jgi:hypothetical protein
MRLTPEHEWWLIANRHYGVHVAWGRSAAEAKADVRDRIAETYAGEGLSPSACRRAASSYGVFAMAGPVTEKEAQAAHDAWFREDWQPAMALARRTGTRFGRSGKAA